MPEEALLRAVAGGVLIGLSATAVLLSFGKVTGVSGIAWRAVKVFREFSQGGERWQVGFIIGLILGPLVAHALFAIPRPSPPSVSLPVLITSGFLVGLGVTVGSGCTSGHGVCGIARFSKRSLVATGVFMAIAILTASVFRHHLL